MGEVRASLFKGLMSLMASERCWRCLNIETLWDSSFTKSKVC